MSYPEIEPCDGVYEPGEDSLLLLEAALTELNTMPIRPENVRALDLGTGTGIIAIALALRGAKVVATDISTVALNCAKANAERNAVNLDLRHGDLFEPVRGETFDLITFNPPYLMEDESLDQYLTTSDLLSLVNPGLLNRFLREYHNYLSSIGRALVVLPEQALDSLPKSLNAVVLRRKSAAFETLVVLRLPKLRDKFLSS